MEYVDLRFDLLRFDHELSVHNAIGRRFAALASGRARVAADIVDVEGYWLPPAALDLVARLEGEHVNSEWERVSSGRDAVRFQLFRLAGGHGFERPELTSDPALALLRERPSLQSVDPDGAMPVARAWRSLWLATADGAHGEEASQLLLDRLAEYRGDASTQQWMEWLVPSLDRSPATVLRAMRDISESILDPANRQTSSEVDAFRAYMEELAGEGSAEARSVLARVRMLRDRLDDRTPGDYPDWRRSVGDVPGLIRQDLFDADAPSAARLYALRVCAPTFRAVCEEAYEASRRPATMAREFRTHGRTITVQKDGIAARDRVAHEEFIATRYPADRSWLPIGVITTAVLLLGLFLFFLGPTAGLGIVLMIASIAGAVKTIDNARSAQRNTLDRRAALDRFRNQVEREQRQITQTAQLHVQQQAEARSDHDAVMAALDRVEALSVA